MKNYGWICLPVIAVLILLSATVAVSSQQTAASPTNVGCILIDPGHGGEDGGAVGADGTLEKNINLQIGSDLRDLFRLWGIPVRMTRDTDVSIYDSGKSTTRQKKVSDMVNRLSLYEQTSLILSIHQNHFSVPKYKGAQVFYSPNREESLTLATAIRERILSGVQPENTRELKRATDGIYLLYHTTKPAVLVECGFLSNPEECAQLRQEDYQKKMAAAVFMGYLEYRCSAS